MSLNYRGKSLYVAPMMAWTDRHCRYLHRLFTPHAMLFTEMVTTGALLNGQQWHQLQFNNAEHPLALQLGGSDPRALATCAKKAAELGYNEINLNVGCPSSRVQQGTFGACLMKQPALVADCVTAMYEACQIPVTVKCRLGVDEVDTDDALHDFVDQVAHAGCGRIYLHARKAILGGLSPAQNRSIPPLQPHRVRRVKEAFPQLEIIINGGITELDQANQYLSWADGIMIGRAAYHNPHFLSQLEQHMFDPSWVVDRFHVMQKFRAYICRELDQGTQLHAMTRHTLHCFSSYPGARLFRQALSNQKELKQNNIQLFDDALHQIQSRAA